MMNSINEIASPCVGVCQLDEQRVCVGCWRSIDEIAAWRSMNNDEKLTALNAAARRRANAENQMGG